MMHRICAGLLLLAALPALAADLRVDDARTAPPLPGTSMMAGYLTLVNEGDRTIRVEGAASPAFARLSLHRSVEQDGQSRMEHVDALPVEPGERIAFEPGGLHLMMFEPAEPPEVGDTLALSLQTDAGTIAVDMQVIERRDLLSR